ncbi:bifunctional tRNA (mnm(5)s(2)U34)-methyltransferase/FAD-dependent cmnm(5)s(2)U34 oxidoreductase [compost metagenome]
MFDAYSSKTTPQLWDEEFLVSFFAKSCDQCCFVSTYSGKAEFKEALRKNGFTVVSREAFYGKRKSTIAHRLLQL